MPDNKNKADSAVDTPREDERLEGPDDDREESGHDETPGRRGGAEARRAGPAVSPFHIYKSGQGHYVRWGSAAGGGLIAVAGAAFAYEQMANLPFDESVLLTVRTITAVGLLAGLSYLVFWLVGQNRSVVDFMIATEGEMKKVNWSSRKEVIGATKVVIVTVLALGIILFVVDMLFIFFFVWIKVLRIDIFGKMFGGGGS